MLLFVVYMTQMLSAIATSARRLGRIAVPLSLVASAAAGAAVPLASTARVLSVQVVSADDSGPVVPRQKRSSTRSTKAKRTATLKPAASRPLTLSAPRSATALSDAVAGALASHTRSGSWG